MKLQQLLFIALLTLIIIPVQSQVTTTIMADSDSIKNYIPWYFNYGQSINSADYVNVDSVLTQDSIDERTLVRLSIEQSVNFDTSHGNFHDFDTYKIWKFTLFSDSAKSLSVKFSNTTLPGGARMYIYNEEHKFVIGPIDSSNFHDETFKSDFLNGDSLKIDVFLPEGTYGDFNVNISSYDHGIRKFRDFDGDFNTSLTCQVNVACDEGNGWNCQIDAVCKIIHSTIGSCTGSLINNGCCDLTPYLLTAEHCVEDNPVEEYIFRFNYESTECDPSEEPLPSTWITHYGAELISSWSIEDEGSDFALLELKSEMGKGVSFAGWDRTDNIPQNSTIIHHPSGDVKKITHDDEPPIIEDPPDLTSDPNIYYELTITEGENGDFGMTEGGTSGAPYYNEEKQIIAQHRGAYVPSTGPSCDMDTLNSAGGRFFDSWLGDGSSDGRLSDWLIGISDPTQPISGEDIPDEMICMRSPYIEGSDILCTSSKQYEFTDQLMPCSKNKSWEVVPTNLFGSSTSGTGSSISLWAANNEVNGLATLTYALTSESCDTAKVTKQFWVGPPDFNIYGKTDFCYNDPDEGIAWLDQLGPYDVQDVSWSFSGSISGNGNSSTAKYWPNNTGSGSVCASVTNDCGTTEICLQIEVEDCGGKSTKPQDESGLTIYPNPNSGRFQVRINSALYQLSKCESTISIFDLNGQLVYNNQNLRSNSVNPSNLKQGVYLLKAVICDKVYSKKIIVL